MLTLDDEAANGEEALGILARREPISVMLLDLTMPGLSAFEFLPKSFRAAQLLEAVERLLSR